MAPLLCSGPGISSLGHLIHLPLALVVQGSHPCLAALVVLAGLCGSSQIVLVHLANQAHLVVLVAQVALVDPTREGDDGRACPVTTCLQDRHSPTLTRRVSSSPVKPEPSMSMKV